MIETYGHILYGYKIDEQKFEKMLGDRFEDFEEEYQSLFGDTIGSGAPGWIPTSLRGRDAYFGIHIWCEDLVDGQFKEPFEIPRSEEYSTMLDNWISAHDDLFKEILGCSENSEPKMLFVVVYS